MTWVTAFPFFLEFGYEATFEILNSTGKREREGERENKTGTETKQETDAGVGCCWGMYLALVWRKHVPNLCCEVFDNYSKG